MKRPLADADLRAGLIRACCSYAGARDRWAELASRGATDQEIRERLRDELGESGGSGGPGIPWVHYKGSSPRVWISWEIDTYGKGQPTYQGAALVQAVRKAFQIPLPEERMQLSLFDIDEQPELRRAG